MRKILSIVLSFGLLFQQSGLVYAVGELNLANYLSQARSAIVQPDQFRPAQLRYISYDIKSNDFKLLLDKGDIVGNGLKPFPTQQEEAKLFNYFLIGLSLPNDTFWVNLRPDAPENIIDPLLEKTDIGKIFLEADLQLKKDTASLTSPQNPEGKLYWDKLYKKAGELFGTENITIPTITRPWIVPNEVIVRETDDSAYMYKATLKVMLEEDYLTSRGGSRTAPTPDQYTFSDPRLKELNEYSTQLIRETIIPKLTKEINSSKRYAQLRQVYYSLVLSRWFKQKYSGLGSASASEHKSTRASANSYLSLIDSGNLDKLASKEPCDKQAYFQAYQKSFKDGEYNLKETVATPFGQSIRSYISGGLGFGFKYEAVNSPVAGLKVNSSPVTDTLTGQPPATTASPLTEEDRAFTLNEIVTKFQSELSALSAELKDAQLQLQSQLKKTQSLLSWLRSPSYMWESAKESAKLDKALTATQDSIIKVQEGKMWWDESETLGEKLYAMNNIYRDILGETLYSVRASWNKAISRTEAGKQNWIRIDDTFNLKGGNMFSTARDILLEFYPRYGDIYLVINKAYSAWKKHKDAAITLREEYSAKTKTSGSPLTVEAMSERIEGILNKLPKFYNGMVNHYERLLLKEKNKGMDGLVAFIKTLNTEIGDIANDRQQEESIEAKELVKKLLSVKEELQSLIKLARADEAGDEASIASPRQDEQKVSSSIAQDVGGIDLTDRMLNMRIERVGSFASSALVLPEINNVEALDLDKEYAWIQAMVSSSIRPSDTRILEFAAACYYRGEFDQRLAQVSSCIKAAHLADELLGRESSPALRIATMLPDALYGG